MIYYTVYKVTNKINGKIYIGSHKTKNLNDNYYGSGKYLNYAIQKYGLENFTKEILFVFDNPKDMYAKEAEIVDKKFLSEENTYNLKRGGFDYLNDVGKFNNPTHNSLYCKSISPFGSKKHIEEGIRKGWFVKAGKITKQLAIGIHDPKLRGSFKGKHHSEDTKKRMSEKAKINSKGEKNSQFGTMWITDGVSNRKIKKNADVPMGWSKGRTV